MTINYYLAAPEIETIKVIFNEITLRCVAQWPSSDASIYSEMRWAQKHFACPKTK